MQSFSIDVHDVCALLGLLSEQKNDDKWKITHLKLQKLLYFAQGFCLGINKKRLFDEVIEAWRHGPVCPNIYHEYKHKSYHVITSTELCGDIENIRKNKAAFNVIKKTWILLGSLSGTQLEAITHQESPWQYAIQQGNNTEITDKSMYNFFHNIIKNIEKESSHVSKD